VEQRPAAKPVAKPISGYNSVLSRYLAERAKEKQESPAVDRVLRPVVASTTPRPAATSSLGLLSRFLNKTADPVQAGGDKR
jgi:hypothetical protein